MEQSVEERVAEWDRRFGSEDYLFGTDPNAFLVRQADRLQPGMKVLAVADGEGRNGVWLAGRGLDVLSVEASSVALKKAQRLARERGVALATEQTDILSWDWGRDRFDAIAAIFIQFARPRERTRLFELMQEALRPGGLLLLQGYRPEQVGRGTGGPPFVENMYTEPMLREAFAAIEILELRSYEADIREGTGHAGMSALIELVARKPAG
ncbi:SAM-dependent methyltransferase [Marinimicrococcus flavescens]|uniref:Class I SAM-dependent methyltransferase n=1 Tax=Marinimicrococcus flavescens TaxID=3031815 RepID=A0AAP4D6B9_9PROT|nr:class I SAM-dependent methyltransferase [Marinimicrococcus flavescens]